MDKLLAKKAARIAVAAKVAGGMFVFASRDPDLHKAESTSAIIAKFKFLEHSCTDCGTKFNAPVIAGMHHNCIACGSGRTEEGAAVKPNIPKDDKLSLVTCKTCGTNNIMPSGVVASTNTLCCTACGHSMNYKLKADLSDDVPMDQEDLNQDLDSTSLDDDGDDSDDMNLIDVQSDLDVDGPSFDDGTDADDGVAGDPAEIPAPEDNAGDLFDDPGAEPGPADALESDANEMPNNDYKRPADVSDEAVNPEDKMTVGSDDADLDPDAPEALNIDMMDQVQDDAPELSFVYLGQTMAIASGTTIVASLKAEDAGENAEILHTAAFQTAVAHSIKTLGLKKACANYGFTSNKVKVKLAPEVTKQVKAKTEQVEAKVTAKLNDLSADFQQALDISAAGFASNFWRNKHDPVKASLITELAALGVRSAEKLVDRVFAAHGVAQSREILAMARELSVQPVEARNGLSQAINLSKYLPTKLVADADEDGDDSDEDEDDSEDDEEATVAPVAVSAKSVIASASHQETATYKSADLQRIMGGKPFSF